MDGMDVAEARLMLKLCKTSRNHHSSIFNFKAALLT